ncbi:DNA cytosine methyltransferase [Jannaschia pohangensis]|nr:DNA cytosine methyltransferase [Jannaschia pohangensis]
MDGTSFGSTRLTSVEVCAGAGGQALGLEQAGFDHLALCEIEAHARATLRLNRPAWNVIEGAGADLKTFDATPYAGVDLLAGGLPCPPFSVAGQQLGARDERNLFDDFLRIVGQCQPKAVFIENVRGFLDPTFADFRKRLVGQFRRRGYAVDWRLLNASDFGVPQLRPRVAIVGFRKGAAKGFTWPEPVGAPPPTVGEALRDQMAAGGWPGAAAWSDGAQSVAPTLVGGSKKHGGPDLGPTRARRAWRDLGVEGRTLAEAPPGPDHQGLPRLTVQMAARIQGFPADWVFSGRKTPAYRQVGNAFPPPVAQAVGAQIAAALLRARVPCDS